MSTQFTQSTESGITSGVPSLSDRDAGPPVPHDAVNFDTAGDALMYTSLPFVKTLSDKLYGVFRDSAVLVCKGTNLESSGTRPTPLMLVGRIPIRKGYGSRSNDDVVVFNIMQRMFSTESLSTLKRMNKKINRLNRRVFNLNEPSTLAVGTCVLYVHKTSNKANLAIVMRKDTASGTVLVVKFSLKRRSTSFQYSQLLLPTKGPVCETVSLDDHVIYKVNGFRFDNIRWNQRNTTCGSEHIYVLSIGVDDVLIHRQYSSMLNQTSHRELVKSTVKMVRGTPPLAITDVPRAAIIGGVERSDHNQDDEEEEEEEGPYSDGEHNDDNDDDEEREDNQDNQDNDERREGLGDYFASETDSTAGEVAHNTEAGVFVEFPAVTVVAEGMDNEGEAEPNPAAEVGTVVGTGEEAEFAIDGNDVIDGMHGVGSRKRTNPVKERDSSHQPNQPSQPSPGQYSKTFVEKVRGLLREELSRLSNLCNDDEHASLEKGLADVDRQILDVHRNIALLKQELAGLQEKRRGLINKRQDHAHIEQQKKYMKVLLDVSPPHKQQRLSV